MIKIQIEKIKAAIPVNQVKFVFWYRLNGNGFQFNVFFSASSYLVESLVYQELTVLTDSYVEFYKRNTLVFFVGKFQKTDYLLVK